MDSAGQVGKSAPIIRRELGLDWNNDGVRWSWKVRTYRTVLNFSRIGLVRPMDARGSAHVPTRADILDPASDSIGGALFVMVMCRTVDITGDLRSGIDAAGCVGISRAWCR